MVAGEGVASLVVAISQIQRFPFPLEFALTAARLFVAVMVLGEAQLVEAASAGFFLLFTCGCFNPGRRHSLQGDGLNTFSWALK